MRMPYRFGKDKGLFGLAFPSTARTDVSDTTQEPTGGLTRVP